MTETRPLSTSARIYAWSLLLNGAIGFASIVYALSVGSGVTMLLAVIALTTPVLGIVTGPFVLRNHLWAYIAGLAFYAVQLVRYNSATFNWAFISGIHLDTFFSSQDRLVAFNLVALGFLALGAVATRGRLTLRSPAI